MPSYRVRPGFTHGAQKQYKAGDIVEFTAEEAAGFLDKLELVSGKKAKAADVESATDLRAAIQGASLAELADALGVDADALDALRQGKGATRQGGLVVNPTPFTKTEATENLERELEAETGKEFTQSGSTPPTFVETDRPAPISVPKHRTTR